MRIAIQRVHQVAQRSEDPKAWLRRVAYLTNRLVPLYKEREIDDRRPPQRLYPPIPMGEAALDETPERVTMEEIGRGGQDLGWQTIGTSGAPNQWAGGQG